MEFLQNKEYFVKQVEATIDRLKLESADWDAKQSIKALASCDDKQLPDYQQVYDWLLDAIRHDTISSEVESLTLEQVRYANYLIQAVYDSVTMVL